MKGLIAALLAVSFICAIPYSLADDIDCETDCRGKCPSLMGIPEPSCYGSCESLKAAAQAAGCIVDVPFPDPDPRTTIEQACAAPFEHIVTAVIAECSNEKGLENHDLITQAVLDLSNARVLDPSKFNGVDIRWCNLRNGTRGITPDPHRIYIDVSLTGKRLLTAATIAHEAVHLGQYARLGGNKFKCEYSMAMAACNGCQDNGNALEKEAYDFESRVRPIISAFLNTPQPNTTQPGSLPSGATTFQCGCPNKTAPFVEDTQCASGVAALSTCQGFCGNGTAVTYRCQ